MLRVKLKRIQDIVSANIWLNPENDGDIPLLDFTRMQYTSPTGPSPHRARTRVLKKKSDGARYLYPYLQQHGHPDEVLRQISLREA